jgi:hypothetical protein
VNRAEWADLAELLEEGFRHPADDPWTDRKDRVYERTLSGYPAEVVAAALRKLLLGGRPWCPAIAEIIGVIEHDPGVPSWDEAEALIFAPASRVRALGMLHPCLEAFIARHGGLAALRSLPVDEPEKNRGHWERKRLREAYDAHRAGWVDKQHHALALGEAFNPTPRVLDPISAIGLRPVPSTPQIGAAA